VGPRVFRRTDIGSKESTLKDRRLYEDPLSAVYVFLSHSWDDYPLTDYLAERLADQFTIFYDRSRSSLDAGSRGLLVGEPAVPETEIVKCDAFIFAASASSLQKDSRPHKELLIAQNLPPGSEPVVAVVALEDFSVPPHLKCFLYLRLKWRDRRRDSEVIADQLRIKLSATGGLKQTSEGLLVSGSDHSRILVALHSEYGKGLYALNAVLPYWEMTSLAKAIRGLGKHDRDNIVNRLVGIYVNEYSNPRCTVARQNAIILASKIVGEDTSILREFERRAPDFPTPFLYRGFHVALGNLGDANSLLDYAMGLQRERGSEWEEQRYINRRFHIDYYGGSDPALRRLRRSLRDMSPVRRLPLNVYTFGEMASNRADFELLEERKSMLLEHGVPEIIVNSASRRIKRKLDL